MKPLTIILFAVALPLMAISGCNSAPGRPATESEVLRPNQVLSFDALYHQNCAGCHGEQGRGGAAIALNSPVYLEIVDDATLRRVTAQGVRGTAMPAHKARVACSPMNKLVRLSPGFAHAGASKILCPQPCQTTARQLRAIRNTAALYTARIVPPATALQGGEEVMPAPLWMIRF